MKYSTAFIVLMIFAVTGSAIAQNKTITNADLEKYREARLAAERDYRENHIRLGMPSPEELARRNEASRKELIELSDKLREQEIAERRVAGASTGSPVVNVGIGTANSNGSISPAVIWTYGYGRDRRYWRAHRLPQGQQYYVSGGSIWPIGARTAPRPLIKVRRR